MASTDIGHFGSDDVSGVSLRDHNGEIEIIPTGQFDYATLSYEDAGNMAKALLAFLAAIDLDDDT